MFVKSKTQNQLIRFVIAYLVAANNIKRETVAATRGPPQTSSLQTYGLLTVLTLILWITGYVEYCRNVFIRNLLKTERRWTKAASDWSVVWHPAKCHWSGNWLMASLPWCMCQSQRKAFWTHVLLQIHSGDCLQKIDILNLSLIKLLQNQQGCNIFASQCSLICIKHKY